MFGFRFSRNAKKIHADQSIVEVSLIVSEKKQLNKPWKLVAAKNFFSIVYVINTICLDWCFLLHVLKVSYYFYESLLLLWGFFSRQVVAFFEISVLREGIILCYLHNANKVLKIKLSYMIMIVRCSRLISFFECLEFFVTVPHFSLKKNLF